MLNTLHSHVRVSRVQFATPTHFHSTPVVHRAAILVTTPASRDTVSTTLLLILNDDVPRLLQVPSVTLNGTLSLAMVSEIRLNATQTVHDTDVAGKQSRR